MDDSQITGATSSYARKYALNGLFCIDDTKDADATNDHGKGGSGHSDGGKAPAGMTAGQTQKAAPQAPAQPQNGQNPPSPRATAEERAALLVKFMQSLGVQREEIEAAIGARVEEFTPQETGIVRDAAKIMKSRNVDFQTAVTEVTR